MAKKPLPTPDQLRQLMRYEPETGKLFWKERPESMFRSSGRISAGVRQKQWNSRYADKEAITANCNGYLYGNISKRSIYAHQIAWAIFHGRHADQMIDHINGIKDDNRIGNLREASPAQNACNGRLRGGVSKYAGVRSSSRGKPWWACIRIDGKKVYLGGYDREEDAALAYDRAAMRYHGEFATLNFPDNAASQSRFHSV